MPSLIYVNLVATIAVEKMFTEDRHACIKSAKASVTRWPDYFSIFGLSALLSIKLGYCP